MVVTMRPMKPEKAIRAAQVTTRFHLTHGAPAHSGDPLKIAIKNLDQPDFDDAVTVKSEEIQVFWACGAISQLASTSAAPLGP
jgi:uncharacterized protein YcsI (UPF0317 family)